MPLFAIPFPTIDPILISIGPFAIRWYALAYIAGLLGGWLYAKRLAANEALWGDTRRPTAADLDDFMVYIALGIVLGGRLGYVLFYNLEDYLARPAEIFAIWRGGMSFHGGFLGAVLAIWLFSRSRELNVLAMLDLSAAVAPIGLFFGRLANFINGELWGRPAPDLSFAVVFPNAGPVPRHPSQIYEAIGEGLILFIVCAVAVKIVGFRRPGLVAGIFCVGYAIARIACELFREPDPQLGFLFGDNVAALGGGVTMGMLLCIPLFVAGVLVIALAASGRTAPRAGVERASA